MPDDVRPIVASITAPEQLLTFMPYAVGCVPDRSLHIALFDQQGSIAVARFGLSDQDLAAIDPDEIWARLAPTIHHAKAEIASLVLYAGPRLVDPVTAIARRAPLPVHDVLRVEADHYWDLTSPDPLCDIAIPWEPDPQILAALAAAGWSQAPTHRDYLDQLRPGRDPHRTADVDHALNHLTPPTPTTAFRLIESTHQARKSAATSTPPTGLDPTDAARILLGLRDDTVRRACLGWHDPHALTLWLDLLGITPPQQAAPLLGLVSVCAYFRGEGERAREAATAALALDPDQPEASLTTNGLLTLACQPSDLTGFIHLAASNAADQLLERG